MRCERWLPGLRQSAKRRPDGEWELHSDAPVGALHVRHSKCSLVFLSGKKV